MADVQEEFEEETEEEQNKEMPKKTPLIETRITKSKDGKWLIHRTIITDIKPISYYEQILRTKRFDTKRIK